MQNAGKITPTLGHTSDAVASGSQQQQPVQKSPHMKRAKWHLGIRSQSRPGIFNC